MSQDFESYLTGAYKSTQKKQAEEDSLLIKPNVEATIHNIKYLESEYEYYLQLLRQQVSHSSYFLLYALDNKAVIDILQDFVEQFRPNKWVDYHPLSTTDANMLIYTPCEYVITLSFFYPGIRVACCKDLQDKLVTYFTDKGLSTEIINKSVSEITWYYLDDGRQTCSTRFAYNSEKTGKEYFYKYLGLRNLSLEQYIRSFKESTSNILLLVGNPGLGKTSFIKKILEITTDDAVITYDVALLTKDSFYIEFMRGTPPLLIIEDADEYLKADKIQFLARMLNMGDGIVKPLDKKKIIITTNLPIKEIPDALKRPGRCFDVLQFREYTKEEAQEIAALENIELAVEQDTYTLAEIFNPANKKVEKKESRKVGFV